MASNFKKWLEEKLKSESSATTRARDAMNQGLYPATGHLKSHTRSTNVGVGNKKKSKKKE